MAVARQRKFNGTSTVASGSDAGRRRRGTEPLFPSRNGPGESRETRIRQIEVCPSKCARAG